MKNRSPIRYVWRNILIGNDGERAAVYRLDTISYTLLPTADKRHRLGQLSKFATGIGADFSVYRMCREYPASKYADRAMDMCDPDHVFGWRKYLAGHEPHLASMATFTPETYVVIALPPESKPGVGTKLINFTDSVRAKTVPKSTPLRWAELERLETAESQSSARITNRLPARRATTREIQWLLARMGYRGVAEPRLDECWDPAALEVEGGEIRPLGTDIWRLTNHPVQEHDRHISIRTDSGTSYQAILSMGDLPVQTVFPHGSEFVGNPLEAVGFPVDAVLHVKWLSNREAGKLLKRKALDSEDAARSASVKGFLPHEVQENQQLVDELGQVLNSPAHPPMLKVSATFGIGANSAGELDKRVDSLRHHMGQLQLFQPLGLQTQMFLDQTLRPDLGVTRDYDQYLTPDAFGSLIVNGTHKLGDGRGAYIGRIIGGSGRPVMFDVTSAPKRGRAPSILLAGTLGSGKTLAMELLGYQGYLRGSMIVDTDPKPDHRWDLVIPPEDLLTIILEGDGQNAGLLDPLRVAPEGMREDLTNSYLMSLLYPAPPAWAIEVRKAVRRTLESRDLRCTRVVEELLRGNADAKIVGAALEVWMDSGMAALAFAPAGSDLHLEPTKRVTTIQARGLTLPSPRATKADYDQSEHIGVATLKLIAAFAMGLISRDRSTHKMFLADEAWVLMASQDGRSMIDRLNRLGRSENATLLLATQRLADAEEIEPLVGTRFIFGMESASEAQQGLALLGLDPEDRSLVDMIRSQRKGACVARDIDGTIARLQFDIVYEELLRKWDTTPGSQGRVAA